jgi:predicted NBD/HSP70 family sugar kinase
MEYFAGLDVSMSETLVCVVTQDRTVIHAVRVPSTPADIVAALKQVPACRRVLVETHFRHLDRQRIVKISVTRSADLTGTIKKEPHRDA